MATYLLYCSCGVALPVTPKQSGEMVVCDCGIQQEVPSLSKMRQLPLADTSGDTGGGWGFRQGVLTAGVMLSLALASVGAWAWVNEPASPEEFNSELRTELVASGVERWTPKTSFEMWRWEYGPMLRRGRLEEFINPREEAIKQGITMARIYRWTFFGLAAAVGVGSIAIAATTREAN